MKITALLLLAFLVSCQNSGSRSSGSTSSETPVAVLPDPEPLPVNTDRPVYPGCEAPAETYSRTLTVDGAKGETLQALFNSKTIRPVITSW